MNKQTLLDLKQKYENSTLMASDIEFIYSYLTQYTGVQLSIEDRPAKQAYTLGFIQGRYAGKKIQTLCNIAMDPMWT